MFFPPMQENDCIEIRPPKVNEWIPKITGLGKCISFPNGVILGINLIRRERTSAPSATSVSLFFVGGGGDKQ